MWKIRSAERGNWAAFLTALMLVGAVLGGLWLWAADALQCGLCGDANGDGMVDIVDALFIAQQTVNLRSSVACPSQADVNADTHVDIIDALLIGQLTVGLRTSLSCGGVTPTATPTGPTPTPVSPTPTPRCGDGRVNQPSEQCDPPQDGACPGQCRADCTCAPGLTSFEPMSGAPGIPVKLHGHGLTGATAVKFNGVTAMFSVASDTEVDATVPQGATSGPISVAAPAGTFVSSAVFAVLTPATFSLSVEPVTASVLRGQSTVYAVKLASSNGFSQLAALQLSGLPPGLTATLTPAQITAGQTAILKVTATAGQPTGSVLFGVSASATVLGVPAVQSANATVSVQPVTTSFLGRTVEDDTMETPLAGVTITFLGMGVSGIPTGCTGQQTVSDAAGNFAFTNLPGACLGAQLIRYDGTTATSPPGDHASVDLIYTIVVNQVVVSPVLVHLPLIHGQETVMVRQNFATDQTFTFKTIPFLSITVYAHTTLTLKDGTQPDPFPLTAVQVPVDRLPEEFSPQAQNSTSLLVFIVAFQPANATASQPVAVTFPNSLNTPPSTHVMLFTLDPTRGEMVPYGSGTVSNDGTQILPNADPMHSGHNYGLVHFDWHGPSAPPPNGVNPSPSGSCAPGANGGGLGGGAANGTCVSPAMAPSHCSGAVDLSSGIDVITANDLSINGPRGAISIIRTLRTLSTNPGPFGVGSGFNFGYELNTFNFIQGEPVIGLVMPDGNQFPFNLVQVPVGQPPTFMNTTVASLRGAALTYLSNGVYNLRWKGGTIWRFQTTSSGGRVAYLTSITDPNGNVISITLNPSVPGQITQVSDPVGRNLTLRYDASGRISSITDPIGRTVQYAYNSAGYLSTVTDPAGGLTAYGYDDQNRLLSITDPKGIVTEQNTYDPTGRVMQKTMADGGVYQFTYFVAFLVETDLIPPSPVLIPTSPVTDTIVTDPRGNRTEYRFTPNGLLTDITDPNGQTKHFTVDPSKNNLVTAITGTATCSVCGASSAGDLHFTLDANGSVLTRKDALGNITSFTYDPTFNKITSITDPLGSATMFEYDESGNLTKRTDANGNTTTFAYNTFGQVTEITDPLHQTTTFSYDSLGNLTSTTDPLRNTTSAVYDAISRPIQTVDALGRKSKTTYDTLERVTAQTNAQGNATEFTYDKAGNLLSVTDAKGHKTSFTYDGLNRLLTKTDPLLNTDSRIYDFNGNLTQFTDRRGQTSHFTYDALNRFTGESYQDATVARVYDANGRLVHVDDSSGGVFDFTYDLVGHLLSSAGPFGAVQYSYDAAGRTLSRQVVGQSMLTYSYDHAGNLLSASLPEASAEFFYDARNELTSLVRANGVSSQYVYDNDGRLLSITDSGGSGTLNFETYVYDPVGNRSEHTANIAQPLITEGVSNTYDTANRLLQSTSNGGRTTYSYDANGNLTSVSNASGTTSYTWDSRNRLQSIAGNGQTATFLYDFARNLISENQSGSVNFAQNFVMDTRTNVAKISHSSGDSMAVLAGRAIDQHLAVVHSSGQVEYALTDAINSTVATVDETGKLVSKFDREPFGQTTTSSSYPFQFTGRVPTARNLYYYRARFYSPTMGRFLSEDPIGFAGGLNLYRYVGNNSIGFNDPTGLAGPNLACIYDRANDRTICIPDPTVQPSLLQPGPTTITIGRQPSPPIAGGGTARQPPRPWFSTTPYGPSKCGFELEQDKTGLEPLGLGPLDLFIGPPWLEPFLGPASTLIEGAWTIWDEFLK